MERTGAPVNSAAGELRPWLPVVADDAVYLPLDASMLSFACLAAMVSGATVQLNGVPAEEDALGNEVLIELASSFGFQSQRRPSSMLVRQCRRSEPPARQ